MVSEPGKTGVYGSTIATPNTPYPTQYNIPQKMGLFWGWPSLITASQTAVVPALNEPPSTTTTTTTSTITVIHDVTQPACDGDVTWTNKFIQNQNIAPIAATYTYDFSLGQPVPTNSNGVTIVTHKPRKTQPNTACSRANFTSHAAARVQRTRVDTRRKKIDQHVRGQTWR